jgi:hypothetical protein
MVGCDLLFAVVLAMLSVDAKAQESPYPWLEQKKVVRAVETIVAPTGFVRTPAEPGSFFDWLRGLPLLPTGSPVLLHDGTRKPQQRVHFAVVDIDTGRRNLQQCADAAIRLYSEYVWHRGTAEGLGYHLTNGMWVPWSRWEAGDRVQVSGNKTRWVTSAAKRRDRKTFRRYLDFIMTYAGTASLAKNLKTQDYAEVQPGDILIQGGSPGHAVMILDEVRSVSGERLVLLGQSYMPAQDFHVLKNTAEPRLSPWFRLADVESRRGLRTPEWRPFFARDLRTFSGGVAKPAR